MDTDKIFTPGRRDFEGVALECFRYQYANNKVYRQFCDAIAVQPREVVSPARIPFLPIRFFKSKEVVTGSFRAGTVFESSGTTGMVNSRHFVKDLSVYETSFLKTFQQFYGAADEWCIIGLLPSYLERGHSSLVYMVDQLMKQSKHPDSGFYLNQFAQLATLLRHLENAGQKTLLIGVTFALLDFAALFPMPLKHTVIMETGGMKGRRREMIRADVHDALKNAFRLQNIHSEYGMTELLSQAYSTGNGIFNCPPWMKILVRDEEDPLCVLPGGVKQKGVINVIDLANINSCSFIATDDLGIVNADGSFEVLGRLDNSDLRGCSLLAL